jgi:mannose-6-phosphate isomerase
MASIIQLECDCNNYEWGKKGEASLAAKYASATPGTSFRTEPDKYYSEIWMGTHPTLPARVLETGEELKDYIKKNPEKTLGKAVSERFGKDLPFLPKVSNFYTLDVHQY